MRKIQFQKLDVRHYRVNGTDIQLEFWKEWGEWAVYTSGDSGPLVHAFLFSLKTKAGAMEALRVLAAEFGERRNSEKESH